MADELCHWMGDGSLWHSIISSAAKRSNCLLCVISNAGFVDSWQWQVREVARTDDDWYFSRLDGPQASWLTGERLAEQRKMLPAIAYSRLWENLWSTGGGDALTTETINAAFRPELKPMTGRERNWTFVAGADLGVKRDSSAVVVLAVSPSTGTIRLAHTKLWKPTKDNQVSLLDVASHILKLDDQFGLEEVAFDPWQAHLLAQTLEKITDHKPRAFGSRLFDRAWMREITSTPKNLQMQASLTLEYFNDRRIQLYDCEPLRRDLHKLRVEQPVTIEYTANGKRVRKEMPDSYQARLFYSRKFREGRNPKVVAKLTTPTKERPMRTLLIVLLTSTAHAGMIEWRHGGHSQLANGLAILPPAEAHYSIITLDDPTPIVEWSFTDIMPSTDLQILPQTFVLNEANAADYGVDWELLTSIYLNPLEEPYNFQGKFDGCCSGRVLWPEFHVPVFTSIDRVEFRLDYYYSSPIGSAVSNRWAVVGEGRIVPEPNAVALLLLALVGALRLRRLGRP